MLGYKHWNSVNAAHSRNRRAPGHGYKTHQMGLAKAFSPQDEIDEYFQEQEDDDDDDAEKETWDEEEEKEVEEKLWDAGDQRNASQQPQSEPQTTTTLDFIALFDKQLQRHNYHQVHPRRYQRRKACQQTNSTESKVSSETAASQHPKQATPARRESAALRLVTSLRLHGILLDASHAKRMLAAHHTQHAHKNTTLAPASTHTAPHTTTGERTLAEEGENLQVLGDILQHLLQQGEQATQQHNVVNDEPAAKEMQPHARMSHHTNLWVRKQPSPPCVGRSRTVDTECDTSRTIEEEMITQQQQEEDEAEDVYFMRLASTTEYINDSEEEEGETTQQQQQQLLNRSVVLDNTCLFELLPYDCIEVIAEYFSPGSLYHLASSAHWMRQLLEEHGSASWERNFWGKQAPTFYFDLTGTAYFLNAAPQTAPLHKQHWCNGVLSGFDFHVSIAQLDKPPPSFWEPPTAATIELAARRVHLFTELSATSGPTSANQGQKKKKKNCLEMKFPWSKYYSMEHAFYSAVLKRHRMVTVVSSSAQQQQHTTHNTLCSSSQHSRKERRS